MDFVLCGLAYITCFVYLDDIIIMAVLYVVQESHYVLPLYFILLLLLLFKRYSPRSLNGFHSYFHTISGLGVV